ncbi:MAG: hypothetical protein ACJA1M_000837 [Alphaproteobacteria bacterium]|jgi:hypothetical protein
MSELNHKANAVIDRLEIQCQTILTAMQEMQNQASEADAKIAMLQSDADKSIQQVAYLQVQNQELLANQHLIEAEKLTNPTNSEAQTQILSVPQIDKSQLQQKLSEGESKIQALEEKYQSTYRLLQKEMVKVDTMQMALELAQRERDIALRKQSITLEQKKLLIKLEHENYKMNEAIERIDYISDSLRKVIAPQVENISEDA